MASAPRVSGDFWSRASDESDDEEELNQGQKQSVYHGHREQISAPLRELGASPPEPLMFGCLAEHVIYKRSN